MKESIIKKAWSDIGKHRNILRNKKLSAKQRSDIAKIGGQANKKKWELLKKSVKNEFERKLKVKVNQDEKFN